MLNIWCQKYPAEATVKSKYNFPKLCETMKREVPIITKLINFQGIRETS